MNTDPFSGGTFGTIAATTALIGITVETVDDIIAKQPAEDAVASTVSSYNEFCTKMLESFYNYASSFAIGQIDIATVISQGGGNPSNITTVV